MPRKVFTAGEVLAAADVNEFLMDQAVQSFAGTAARGSAIPSPVEGMAAYLEDANLISLYDGSAWKTSLATTGGVLQVLSTTLTSVFSVSIASGASSTITGLSVSITPKSTSSKVLVIANINGAAAAYTNPIAVFLTADGTPLAIGDADGSRSRIGGENAAGDANESSTVPLSFLHSPNTTSAVTYAVSVLNRAGTTQTQFINRTRLDTDAADRTRSASTITVMEIAG
jgi:hypothetical protein